MDIKVLYNEQYDKIYVYLGYAVASKIHKT